MEPFTTPTTTPARKPCSLRLRPTRNSRPAVLFHLSRFPGYAGIANFNCRGASVVADAVIQPIVRRAAKRGLGLLMTDRSAPPARLLIGGRPDLALPRARVDLVRSRRVGKTRTLGQSLKIWRKSAE